MESYNLMTDRTYLRTLRSVYDMGSNRPDRTGTGTISLDSVSMSFTNHELASFPILLSKKVLFNKVKDELAWFVSGSTNVNDLPERTQNIWRPWASEDGSLGPIYGEQLRGGNNKVDQLARVVKSLKEDPYSRRHVITLWNPNELEEMNLPPCHGTMIQFVVTGDVEVPYLNMIMHQRSGDMFLGVPFNISSYALLHRLVAREVGIPSYRFTYTIGDAHIYLNHDSAVREQFSRIDKLEEMFLESPPVQLSIPPEFNLLFSTPEEWDNIELIDYNPLPFISAPVSV